MIKGVIIKKLETFQDTRGFFREIFRFEEEYVKVSVGQLSHSLVKEGIIKAWHGHKNQSQWNYIVLGKANVVLYDNRSDSSTFQEKMEFHTGNEESPMAYYFPQGVLHGYKCVKGPMHIIYVTSGVYDLSDEVRISEDNNSIRYNW